MAVLQVYFTNPESETVSVVERALKSLNLSEIA